MLISHFNMDSQLILSQKLSHFECASKQHLVRGFHNPLILLSAPVLVPVFLAILYRSSQKCL